MSETEYTGEDTDTMSEAFYIVHYAIAPIAVSPVNYDPFSLNDDELTEYGLEKIKRSLLTVIENQNLVFRFLEQN